VRIEGAAVAGIGMVRFGSYRDIPSAHLARDAGLAALHDAGITLADVDEAFVGYIQPAAMLGIKAMKELGPPGCPSPTSRTRPPPGSPASVRPRGRSRPAGARWPSHSPSTR
jgi:hypothetical protein